MEQTVYADLLFMINFSMDFLCLYLVAKLLSRRFSLLRGALSASIGGIYAIVSLFLPSHTVFSFATDLFICVLMCAITFFSRKERPSSLVISAISYFLASVLLGGIMTAIFHMLNRSSPPDTLFSEGEQIPFWLFTVAAAAASLILRFGGRFLRSRAQIKCAEVEVTLDQKSITLHAICDSGNLLRDAVSGKPVIISDKKEASELLPKDIPPPTDWNAELLTTLPKSLAARIRMIPTSTANGESLMLAIRPDSLLVKSERRTQRVDALIGFADVSHAPTGHNALIPPDLIP